MHEKDIDGVIGLLNMGIIVCNATNTDLVHIPVEDAREILTYLEDLKTLMKG